MKRVVVISQKETSRRPARDPEARERKPRGLSSFKGWDSNIHLTETSRSKARYAQREATLKSNQAFRDACALTGIPATPRQARKWDRRQGKAFRAWEALRPRG